MGIQKIIRETIKRRKYGRYIRQIAETKQNKNSLGRVLICECYTTNYWPCLVKGLVIAKGMADKGYSIEMYSYARNSELDELAKCMGFNRFVFELDNELEQKRISFAESITSSGSNKDILGIEYRGVVIGPELYDIILRETDLLTIDHSDLKKNMAIVLEVLRLVDDICDCIEKGDVKCVLVPEDVYRAGIVIKIANKYGIDAIDFFVDGGRFVRSNELDQMYYHVFMKKLICGIFEKAKKGQTIAEQKEIGWNPADIGKEKLVDMDDHEARRIMGIDNDFPIVIIMSHCLTDAPHCQKNMMYKDYYTWLLRTIQIISDIKGINWVVKEHPARSYYFGEENSVRELCNKYDNIKLFPDKYNNSVIKKVASAVVTFSGTCGIELSAEGVPIIVSGTPWYKGLGFTFDAYNEEQYKEILSNIKEIKLTPEQISLAQEYYDCYKEACRQNRTGDDFNTKLFELWGDAYKEKRKADVNYEALKILADYYHRNSIEHTDYYKIGFQFE